MDYTVSGPLRESAPPQPDLADGHVSSVEDRAEVHGHPDQTSIAGLGGHATALQGDATGSASGGPRLVSRGFEFIEEPPPPRSEPSFAFRVREMMLGEMPPCVFVPTVACTETGGGYAAILLSQLFYWTQPDATGRCRAEMSGPRRNNYQENCDCPDQVGWAVTYRSLFQQTGITKDKCRRALKRLQESGTIVVFDSNDYVALEPRAVSTLFVSSVHHFDFWRNMRDEGKSTRIPGVTVSAQDILVTRTANQAIVLANVLFWWRPNAKGRSKLRIFMDEVYWRANSYAQLCDETGLTPTQIKRAVTGLVKDGLLHRMHGSFRGKRTLLVRPNFEKLQADLKATVDLICAKI